MAWQAKRAATHPPREPKLVITPATPCAVCSHPRSSHSMVIVQGRCHARVPCPELKTSLRTGEDQARVPTQECECEYFTPVCGCGHLYDWHVWSCPPDPWGCAKCPCKQFGAAQEASPVYQAALFDMTR